MVFRPRFLAGQPLCRGFTLSLCVGAPALLRADKGTIEAQYSSLERLEETPHACFNGWAYLGFEGEDEQGEHVEE